MANNDYVSNDSSMVSNDFIMVNQIDNEESWFLVVHSTLKDG